MASPHPPIKIPTVNVVISLDYELMREFLEEGSLKKFKEKAISTGSPTAIFDNSINSNFISLEHDYGVKDGATITVEFLDPTYAFEANTSFDIDIGAITSLPNDPFAQAVKARNQQLEKELGRRKGTAYGLATGEAHKARVKAQMTLNKLTNRLYGIGEIPPQDVELLKKRVENEMQKGEFGDTATSPRALLYRYLRENRVATEKELIRDRILDQRIKLIKEKKGLPDNDAIHAASKRVLKILLDEKFKGSFFQDPVYIAYGVGDKIKEDWCTPQCFGSVYRAEYAYSGDGARVLKLVFGGLGGIGGVLARIGTNILGESGQRIVTAGESDRLFNPDADARRSTFLMDMLYDVELRSSKAGVEFPFATAPITPALPGAKTTSDGAGGVLGVESFLHLVYPAVRPKIPGCVPENRLFTPSLHLAFKECMTRYIEAAIPELYAGNVLVFFPNIDEYIKEHWVNTYGSAWGRGNLGGKWPVYGLNYDTRITLPGYRGGLGGDPALGRYAIGEWGDASGTRWFNAFQNVADSLGLMLVHTPPAPMNSMEREDLEKVWDYSEVGYGPQQVRPPEALPKIMIGRTEANRVAGQVDTPNLREWWVDKNISLLCKNNFHTPFVEKLASVAGALSNAFNNSKANDAWPLSVQLYIETDQAVLTAMKDNGLIRTDKIPAVIWADSFLKSKYLDARVVGEFGGPSNDVVKVAAKIASEDKNLHLIDRLGVNANYLISVFNQLQPTPHEGPFGWVGKSATDLDSELQNDPNVKKSYDKYMKDHAIMANRLPIFSFGVKSSNILSVKLDLNNVYTSFLHMNLGKALANQIVNSDYILAPLTSKNAVPFTNLGLGSGDVAKFFVEFRELKKERAAAVEMGREDTIPQKFKKMVDPWWATARGGATSIAPGRSAGRDTWMAHGQWNAVFDRLEGGGNTLPLLRKRITELEDSDEDKKEFYQLMWETFSRLYAEAGEAHVIRHSYTLQPGKNTIGQSIRTNAQTVDRLMSLQLVGKITTLPMFSLSNPRQALNRSCLLYGREPRFANVGVRESEESITHSTWFSGIYTMYGWKHVIRKDTVESEFFVSRDTRYSATTKVLSGKK